MHSLKIARLLLTTPGVFHAPRKEQSTTLASPATAARNITVSAIPTIHCVISTRFELNFIVFPEEDCCCRARPCHLFLATESSSY
jgi:hypothetical protein